jgi:hypothetical protein
MVWYAHLGGEGGWISTTHLLESLGTVDPMLFEEAHFPGGIPLWWLEEPCLCSRHPVVV